MLSLNHPTHVMQLSVTVKPNNNNNNTYTANMNRWFVTLLPLIKLWIIEHKGVLLVGYSTLQTVVTVLWNIRKCGGRYIY